MTEWQDIMRAISHNAIYMPLEQYIALLDNVIAECAKRREEARNELRERVSREGKTP